MKYNIVWADKKVLNIFQSLQPDTQDRLKNVILKLSDEPRPSGAKMLAGKLKGVWRIRIGDFRVLYDIDDTDKNIFLLDVGHRKHIYR